MRALWNSSGGSQGAFVVATSSSWGIDGEDPGNHPVWCSFYTTLGEAGILSVGATTNSNLNVDTAGDMPTACSSPYMVGVGRTDHLSLIHISEPTRRRGIADCGVWG